MRSSSLALFSIRQSLLTAANSDSPTPKYVVVARMVPTNMYSVHGTIYPFTQGSHSDSADCSSNVFMAEASRPFESCVSLVFVLTRCFRLFLTCATLPFLQIWLVVVTRVGKAEVGWTRSGDSAAWLWRMKSSEGCCGRMGDEGRLCGIETVPHLCMAVFSAWLNWPSCVIYSFSHLPLWFSGDF